MFQSTISLAPKRFEEVAHSTYHTQMKQQQKTQLILPHTSTPIRGVLFDVDGTLLQTANDLLSAINQVITTQGYPAATLESLQSALGDGSDAMLSLSLQIPSTHPEFADFRSAMHRAYLPRMFNTTTPYPGIEDTLRCLESQQIPWGIVTNRSRKFCLPLLEYFRWHQRAHCIVTRDTLNQSKPNPSPLLYGACRLGLPPQQVLYIGDHWVDFEAARQAQMPFWFAAYGYLQSHPLINPSATHCIVNSKDLPQFFAF